MSYIVLVLFRCCCFFVSCNAFNFDFSEKSFTIFPLSFTWLTNVLMIIVIILLPCRGLWIKVSLVQKMKKMNLSPCDNLSSDHYKTRFTFSVVLMSRLNRGNNFVVQFVSVFCLDGFVHGQIFHFHIVGMVGPIDVKRKGLIYVRRIGNTTICYLADNITLTFFHDFWLFNVIFMKTRIPGKNMTTWAVPVALC